MSVDEVSRGSGSDTFITAATTRIGASASSVEGDPSSDLSEFTGFTDSDMSLSTEMRRLDGMPSPGIGGPDVSRIPVSGGSPGILGGSSIFDDSGPDLGSVESLPSEDGSAAVMSPGGSTADTSSRELKKAMGIKEDGTSQPDEQGEQGEQGGGGAGQGTTDPVHMRWGKDAQRAMQIHRDQIYKAAGGGGGGATQPAVSELTWEEMYPGRTRQTCPKCGGFTEGELGFPVTCPCKAPNTETRAQQIARLDGTDEDAIRLVWKLGIGEEAFTRKQRKLAARMRKEDARAVSNICETCGNKVNMEAAKQPGDGVNWEALGPCDCPLPPGWEQYTDGQGRRYYYNKDTKETTWTRPFPEPSPGLHSRVSRLKF